MAANRGTALSTFCSDHNREVLASLSLEPRTTPHVAKPAVPTETHEPFAALGDSFGGEASQLSPTLPPPSLQEQLAGQDKQSNSENTELVIACMKHALRISISNISELAKQRPLRPDTDFTFKAKAVFQTAGLVSGSNARRSSNSSVARRRAGCGVVCGGARVRGERSDDDNSVSDEGDTSDHEPANASSAGARRRRRLPEQQQQQQLSPAPRQQLHVDDRGEFLFTDYAPMCYRHIREFFGVDAATYQDVLCNSKWHSIPTPGKSTAQLFFCGQNWVIKTMTKEESKFLREILHRYYYHVRDNPYTLLPHFVGHHSITLRGKTPKITFVIMCNVFATPNKIHEKFDLKGSTVGRFATKEERRKLTCTKKDLDVNRPVLIGHQRRAILLEQTKSDCDFLRKCGVMDYSFLLGIHVVAANSTANTNARSSDGTAGNTGATVGGGGVGDGANDGAPIVSAGGQAPLNTGIGGSVPGGGYSDGRCFTSEQGGMLSLDLGELSDARAMGGVRRREIYYVGIIDILQEYNLWKGGETVVMGFIHNRKQISSVPPKDYASRFVSFVEAIIG